MVLVIIIITIIANYNIIIIIIIILRSLTLVKGIKWPEKLSSYMKSLSELGDVPLYDAMAC